MTWLIELNSQTRNATFSISNASELDQLPTTTKTGQGNLSTVQTVAPGSAAYLTDGTLDIYILDGDTDTWKLS